MKRGEEVVVAKLPLCDFCKSAGKARDARYDAVVYGAGWAYMCQSHYEIHGIGLGTGVGQKLVLEGEAA